jgi:hypothetical protein
MGDNRFRRVSWMLLVAAAVAGLAACSGGGGTPGASASATATADKALTGAFSGSDLKRALLTKVNGVGAATPASSGTYSSLSAASTGEPSSSADPVTPKACVSTARGFSPGTLSGAQAAAVSFKISGNGVSEVLIASSSANAATALAGKMPAQCATYQEKVGGKTVTYNVTEKTVTGIGKQARELNVRSGTSSSDNLWSLLYRGAGFVGTVTVTGPNASEAAVRELAQQAYAFAAKSLP